MCPSNRGFPAQLGGRVLQTASRDLSFYSCMKMKAHVLGCFIFLALLMRLTCSLPAPFTLEGKALRAKEGSCIKLTCKVTSRVPSVRAYWFWMKDPVWIENHKNYSATIVYSTNNVTRPVSPEFAGRVQYAGDPSSNWTSEYLVSARRTECSILICNLNKNDSGRYMFRFIGNKDSIWRTETNIPLTVTDNPCPITFDKQPVMKENDTITLRCSTLSSCPSSPQIGDLQKPLPPITQRNFHKNTSVSFTATWQDDGRLITCQDEKNRDTYLMSNISITVEYAPKETQSTINQDNIKEGDSVTLTCSAKGNPAPTFTWFKKNDKTQNTDTVTSSAEWKIASVRERDSGRYYCQAKNKYGIKESQPVTFNVWFAPDVEIKTMSPTTVTEGDIVTLRCDVKRSNPQPRTYSWLRNGTHINLRVSGSEFKLKMKPEDSGSYTCEASNTEGTGRSNTVLIEVQYPPRNPKIESDGTVKVGGSLTLTCNTDANPAPYTYSWYRDYDELINSLPWTLTRDLTLTMNNVQRADEGCYMCKPTNRIGPGPHSDTKCIKVLYPPVPVLSMATEVTEHQTVTISCSAESSPPPTLSLTMSSTSNARPLQLSLTKPRSYENNQLNYTFSVTSGDAGSYICEASNSEGSKQSTRTLVVRYVPKDVRITGQLEVHENQMLNLSCTAKSFPSLTSFSWMKDGKQEFGLNWKSNEFIVESVSPSDSGTYRCAASNSVGTTQSQAAEVKVKYAPKHTEIIASTELSLGNGRSYITLKCSVQCYPPATEYTWYMEGKQSRVHDGQTHTVFSDEPGVYYCVARNAINERRSEPMQLFDSTFTKVLKICLCLIVILLIAVMFFLGCRHRKNNSGQRGPTQLCFNCVGWTNGARRGPVIHGTFLAGPSRSNDDLLPDRSRGPHAEPCNPAAGSMPVSDGDTVYSVVKLAPQKQAASAQKATGLQGGHTEAHSLTYASLHFGNKTNNKQLQAAKDDIYAKVCKSTPRKKDYENVGATVAAKAPKPLGDDSSDDDVQLNYAKVHFTANPGRQRGRDSSSSDDYDIQYSDIRI